jgi:hypothetical protein
MDDYERAIADYAEYDATKAARANGENESICIVSKPQVSKVLKIRSAEKCCRVVGSTESCKDSGEYATIKNMVSFTTRKTLHRP